jgi:hypothetical protein
VIFVGGVVVLVALIASSYLKFQSVDDARSNPVPTPFELTPTALPPSILCSHDEGPLPSMLAGDPCPGAVEAVESAVSAINLPPERIVVESGPFFCDDIWPGVGSPAVCFGFDVRPGQFMHGWVRFRDSDRIAAVMLGLDVPDDVSNPHATRPPWSATLVAVQVPPGGWVMP